MDISKELLAEDIFEYRKAYFTAKFDFRNRNANADKIVAPERLFTSLFTMIENYAKHPSFVMYSDNWKDDMKENAQDIIMVRAIRYDKFTGKSPFAYITMIIHNIFIAEINRRKLEMTAFEAISRGEEGKVITKKERNHNFKSAPEKFTISDKQAYRQFQYAMVDRGVELKAFTDKEMELAFIAHKEIVEKCGNDDEIRERLTSELNG